MTTVADLLSEGSQEQNKKSAGKALFIL